VWPDAAVSAIVSLEKASHEALSTDFQKYNQKLRQLDFNLKVRSWHSPYINDTLEIIIIMIIESLKNCILKRDFQPCFDFCSYSITVSNKD
jgi:hypothetical protein